MAIFVGFAVYILLGGGGVCKSVYENDDIFRQSLKTISMQIMTTGYLNGTDESYRPVIPFCRTVLFPCKYNTSINLGIGM